MRKILGWVALALGTFCIVAALVARFWAPGVVEKTPLDVDSTTRLDGTADKLNPASGEVESVPVNVTSVTQVDSDASDDDVVVFVSSVCVVIDEDDPPDCVSDDDPQNRLINASTDAFATDRVDAEAVDNGDYLPPGTEQKEGLVNKFPFGTEKRDYEYWDGVLGEAVPAVFDRTEDVDGLETYVFTISIPETRTVVTGDIEGLYTAEKEIWVEPKTGSIVDQTQRDIRTTEEGDTLIDLDVAFTDEQVEAGVEDGKAGAGQLDMVTKTGPLVGLIVGVILLLIGIGLLLTGRTRRAH